MLRPTALLVTCSCLLLAGCSDAAGPTPEANASSPQFVTTPAAGATSHSIPIHTFRSSDCDDDVVEITGTAHALTFAQRDGSIIGHTNYRGVSAVGITNGVEYRVTGTDHFYLQAPFPSDIHQQGTFRLISKASGENLHVHVLFHVTVNATGEVSVSINELTSECR